jgi:CheY-like chemotaxis protein
VLSGEATSSESALQSDAAISDFGEAAAPVFTDHNVPAMDGIELAAASAPSRRCP